MPPPSARMWALWNEAKQRYFGFASTDLNYFALLIAVVSKHPYLHLQSQVSKGTRSPGAGLGRSVGIQEGFSSLYNSVIL